MNQKQNDFDSWIRLLAEDAESPFHEESWREMDKLLDQNKKRKYMWWLLPLVIGTTLLLIPTLWYINFTNSFDAPVHIELKEAELVNYSYRVTVENAFRDPGLLIQTGNNINASILPNTALNGSNFNNRIRNKINSSTTGLSLESINSNLRETSPNNIQITGAPSQKIIHFSNNSMNAKKQIVENSTSVKGEIEYHDKGESSTAPENQTTIRNTNTVALRLNFLDTKIPNPFEYLVRIRNLDLPGIPSDLVKKLFRDSPGGVLLSIHASPELTSVPKGSFSKPGTEIGFNLGYQLGRHWSVQSGLQFANKVYTAGAKDYEVHRGEYLWGKKINNIDAKCSVIEWPVTMGYTFKVAGKHYFQINMGISSIRMNKEDYAYDYEAYGNLHNFKTLVYSTKKWQMWSSLVGSIAYQKPVSKHLLLSFSPYLKVPVKGVGEGNISLQSLGTQLSLTYRVPAHIKN